MDGHIHTAAAAPGALPLRPPANRVDPRAVRWWRVRDLITTVVLVVPQVVAMIVLGVRAPGVLPYAVGATVLLGGLYAALVPPLLFRIVRWEITDDAVYSLSGWLVREWRIVPISRVQTVDTERGPLQQLFGLATVTVTTASARGPVKIHGLDADDAAGVARVLTETAQATPGDAT